ncbi:hypothetical protein Tco_0363472 [Tanacetum coccineum]
MLNPLALVAQQQPFTHFSTHLLYYTQNSSTRSQQAATRNRGKAIVNSSPPIYDQEPDMVTEDDALSKEKEIDKLMALISLSFKKIYKPTNNNLELHQIPQEMSKTETAKAAAYHKEKMLLCKQEEAGIQLSAEQVDWRDDTNDEPEDQELEAHYLYMAKIQEVTSDAADNSGPILDRTSKQPDLLMTHIQNEQALEKQSLENELSKGNTTSKSFEALQQHAINLELALQQCQEQIKNDKPWKQKESTSFIELNLVEIILFIVDSGCSKHMTGNLKLLRNVTIKRVYYVEGLNHNLFSVGQLCDAYFEVAFRKSTCYIRDLKGNDLLTDSPWFWHRRLSHLNFDTINLLSKYDIVIGLTKLKFIKYYLVLLVSCGKQNLRHSQHQMSRIFYLLLHGTTLVVSESSFVHAVDAPDQRQQHNITLSTSTTVAADTPPLNIQTTPVTTSQAPTQEQLSLLQITLILDTRKTHLVFLGGKAVQSNGPSKKHDSTSTSSQKQIIGLYRMLCSILWIGTHLTNNWLSLMIKFLCTVEKGIVELFFVGTEYQLANLFTKALPEERFKYLVRRLGMRCLTPEELEVLANESS